MSRKSSSSLRSWRRGSEAARLFFFTFRGVAAADPDEVFTVFLEHAEGAVTSRRLKVIVPV